MKIVSSCLSLLFTLCICAHAQSPEGALVGTVSDATGARIAAATVTVSARDYALSRTAKTGKLGEFSLETLPPGEYEVTVEAPGFASKAGHVTVSVTSASSMNITLQPASVQQSVRVEGTGGSLTAQPIETSSSVVKTTIGSLGVGSPSP